MGPNMGDANLARYLKYFSVGAELLEEGPEPNLKSGTLNQAYAALSKHIWGS